MEFKFFNRNVDRQYLYFVSRLMRAVLLLFLVEIKHGPIVASQWDQLVLIGIVTSKERNLLDKYSGAQRNLVMLDWVARGTTAAHRRSDFTAGTFVKGLCDRLIEFDESQKRVLDIIRMPVPFQYYHLLNYMVFINVALWAYRLAFTRSIFGPIAYVMASSIFIGMLELAKMFQDPLGEDEVDFPVHLWLRKFLENQDSFLRYDELGPLGDIEALAAQEGVPAYDPAAVADFMCEAPGGSNDPLGAGGQEPPKRPSVMQGRASFDGFRLQGAVQAADGQGYIPIPQHDGEHTPPKLRGRHCT
eukprot:TRINITY_DN11028_c0_g1_i3.p1 TRINITY_DN11028_c0_g1~~TRINITY_DN11028_c0_g1_i3.p1  ORF type:complete len:302 (-),score=51.13 TRINITY_DN11028_c0_g1_i3:217-1122(-)